MSLLGAKFGLHLPPRLADAAETVIRITNVLVSHARAYRHPGLVIMDRHLHCQLALRQVRHLPRGRLLPFLLARLPKPDLVVHLVITPEQAHERVRARGTDAETLAELDSFRAAYQMLPEYPQFTELAADGTPDDVLARLTALIALAGGTPAAAVAEVPSADVAADGSGENRAPRQDVIHRSGSGHAEPWPDEAA